MVTRPINLTAALKCDLIASRCQHFQVDREAASPPAPSPHPCQAGKGHFVIVLPLYTLTLLSFLHTLHITVANVNLKKAVSEPRPHVLLL